MFCVCVCVKYLRDACWYQLNSHGSGGVIRYPAALSAALPAVYDCRCGCWGGL